MSKTTIDESLIRDGAVTNVKVASGIELTKTDLDADENNIVNVSDPINPLDAANKQYIDSLLGFLDNTSYFNSTNKTTTPTVSAVSTTSRNIANPNDSSYSIGDWVAGSSYSTTNDSSLSYSTNNQLFSIYSTATTLTVQVIGDDDTTVLFSHAVNESGLGDDSGFLNGNYNEWKTDNGNAIQIIITDFESAYSKYKAKASVNINLDNITTIQNGGRFSIKIIHSNSADGDFEFSQGPMFYDPNDVSASVGSVSISETSGNINTIHISGVEYYGTGSQFTVDVSDIDNLNDISYPSNQINLDGYEYGLNSNGSYVSLQGIHLTGWNTNNNVVDASYQDTAWDVSVSNFYNLSNSANVRSRAIDWSNGSWVNSSNANIAVCTYSDNSTRTFEDFRLENKRYQANLSTVWDSTTDLGSYSGNLTALQVQQSRLIYPTVDYSSYNPNSGSQPDYSALTGNRVYYRSFWHTDTSHSNMIVQFTDSNLAESDLTNDDFKIEWSLNGTDWYDGSSLYTGGALSNGSANRIDNGSYDLDGGTKMLRFTLGLGLFTSDSTGDSTNNWGIWMRITYSDSARGKAIYIGGISITDW